MSYVFISYRRNGNTKFAKMISNRLNELGVGTWMAGEKLKAAHKDRLSPNEINKINQAVDQSSAVLVLWSRQSFERPYVISEAAKVTDDTTAVTSPKNNTRLVQAIIDELDPAKISIPFNRYEGHQIKGLEKDTSPQSWHAILGELSKHLARPGLSELDAAMFGQQMSENEKISCQEDWCRKFPSDPMADEIWNRIEDYHQQNYQINRKSFLKRRDGYLKEFEIRSTDAIEAIDSKFLEFLQINRTSNLVLIPEPNEFWKSSEAKSGIINNLRKIIVKPRHVRTVWFPHEVDEHTKNLKTELDDVKLECVELKESCTKLSSELSDRSSASLKLTSSNEELKNNVSKIETINNGLKSDKSNLEEEVRRLKSSHRKRTLWSVFQFLMTIATLAYLCLLVIQNSEYVLNILGSF